MFEIDFSKEKSNANIICTLLEDDEMRDLGFTITGDNNYWTYFKYIIEPTDQDSGISFTFTINMDNPKDYIFKVINENINLPYDYQSLLSTSDNILASKVYTEINKIIDKLSAAGLIAW